MTPTSEPVQRDAQQRKQTVIAATAIVVILACVGFLVWLLWPAKPVVVAESTDPASQWIKSYNVLASQHSDANDPFYLATARVRMLPTPEGDAISVNGSVSNAQQLALLKAELGKLTPTVPLTWNVSVTP